MWLIIQNPKKNVGDVYIQKGLSILPKWVNLAPSATELLPLIVIIYSSCHMDFMMANGTKYDNTLSGWFDAINFQK